MQPFCCCATYTQFAIFSCWSERQLAKLAKRENKKQTNGIWQKMISRDSFAIPNCAPNTYVDVVLFDLSVKLFRHFL